MARTILAMDAGHPQQMEVLQEHFDILKLRGDDPEAVIRDHAQEILAITTFLTPVSASLIKALPNLEIIACGAVGVDHIDMEAARARDVRITHTPDVLTADTADVAMMLMLNLARRGVEGDAFIRAGMWRNGPLPLGTSLSGKRLGIVGLGRIGRAVAARAEAFQMEIFYTARTRKDDVRYEYLPNISDLAAKIDLLVITCHADETTKGMIDLSVLKAVGPQGYLVNIARGSIVNENDLLIALKNKNIAGAGLDVFEHEPHVPEALFTMDNVVLSPHVGSATRETRTKMGRIVVENLLAHFAGEPLLTPIT